MAKFHFYHVFLLTFFSFCLMQDVFTNQAQSGTEKIHWLTKRNVLPSSQQKTCSGKTVSILGTMTPFAGKYMEKVKNNFQAISPAGLFFMFGMLLNLADVNSGSSRELQKELGLPRHVLPPYRLEMLNRYLGMSNVTSINAAYIPKSQMENISPDANTVFTNSKTMRFTEIETLNKYVKDQTKEKVSDLKIENNENIHLFNVITLQFEWYLDFHPQNYTSQFNNINTTFITVIGNMKAFTTTIPSQKNNNFTLRAVELTYAHRNDAREKVENKNIRAYLIDIGDIKLDAEILEITHKEFAKMDLGNIGLRMPTYKLTEETKFTQEHYSTLLARKNLDFTSLGPEVESIALTQEVSICVDKKGTIAAATTKSTVFRLSSANALEPYNFTTPFYHVIVEASTGAPLFIGHVTQPRNEDCN